MCSSYLVLQGAVSKAGRDSTLEAYASSQADLDTLVREQVQQVFANAEVTFSRKAYDRFDQVGVEERYTDENENGSYDIGECYDDSNGNGQWDADRGRTGNGGADDVILYSASMTFDRILPVWRIDRQSVVEGKSGSGRVDLGGGRIIKKKK